MTNSKSKIKKKIEISLNHKECRAKKLKKDEESSCYKEHICKKCTKTPNLNACSVTHYKRKRFHIPCTTSPISSSPPKKSKTKFFHKICKT